MLNQITRDIKVALAAAAKGDNIIFGYLGMPGIGKTQMIKQATHALGLEFFGDMVLSSCSPMDILGKVPNMEDEVLSTLPNDDIPLAYRVGDTAGVWFIDEITNATSDTLKALQQGLLSRKFGKHVLGKNVVILLAGNRQSDKAGSSTLSSAVYNRVTWRNLDWSAAHSDRAVEYIVEKHEETRDNPALQLKAKEFSAIMQGYFAHQPMLEKDFSDALSKLGKEPFIQWCSPRSLESLVSRASCMGWEIPGIMDMAGDIGMSRATGISTFASLIGKLDSYEKVVKDPSKAKLPDAMDAKYAMLSMLAVRAEPDAFDKVWEYISRLQEVTLRVVFLRMAMQATPALRDTKTYGAIYKTDHELVAAISAM